MNLGRETRTVIKNHNLKPLYVQLGNGNWCSYDDFIKVADTVIYDDGYGTREIIVRTILCEDGSFLLRGEYDGSEWWDVYPPIKPPTELTNKVTVADIYCP